VGRSSVCLLLRPKTWERASGLELDICRRQMLFGKMQDECKPEAAEGAADTGENA